MKIIIFLSIVLLLTSCDNGYIPKGKDNNGFFIYTEECVKSNEESYMTFMYTGKVMIPITNYREVCDSSIFAKKYIPIEKVNKQWLDKYLQQ